VYERHELLQGVGVPSTPPLQQPGQVGVLLHCRKCTPLQLDQRCTFPCGFRL
jgi:hypothetical protein